MQIIFGTRVLQFALQAAIPLTLGAMCGILCERSGLLNVGIEGMMLVGAFTAFLAMTATRHWSLPASLGLSVMVTLLAGWLFGFLHAFFCIFLRLNQILSGVALIIFAQGATTHFLDRNFLDVGSFANAPIPLLSEIPVIGALLFDKPPLTYTALLSVLVLGFALNRTRWGLRTRAVGENPRAVESAGINVRHLQYLNISIGGALAALGGGYLVLEAAGQFQQGITAGRGFISLAAVILGNWSPLGALGAALLFGYTQAIPKELLTVQESFLPSQFISMLPYVVTIITVSIFVGRVRPPAALGHS